MSTNTKRRAPAAVDRHGGAVRVGQLMALPGLLHEMGVPPRCAFDRAGVRPRAFADAENFISYEEAGRLLAGCVHLTGCAHFALLVGGRAKLADFGLLGEQMRHATTVGEALRVLLLQLYLFDSVAVPLLVRTDTTSVLLAYSTTLRDMEAVDQVYDLAIAVGFKLMRELGGASWRPLEVQFAHRPPVSAAPYRQLFGAPVRFDCAVSGLLFRQAWLERAIDGADAAAGLRARRGLEQATADQPMPFSYQVERVLHQLLVVTSPSSDDVARLFAISPRALRLRLQADGTSFQQLLERVRFGTARRLMQNTRLDLSAVAAALRYADLASFSRAFSRWAGSSPRRWRAAHAGTPPRG